MDEISIQTARSMLANGVRRWDYPRAEIDVASGLADGSLKAVQRNPAPDCGEPRYTGCVALDDLWWRDIWVARGKRDIDWETWLQRGGLVLSRAAVEMRVLERDHQEQLTIERERSTDENWDLDETFVWLATHNQDAIAQLRTARIVSSNCAGQTGRQYLRALLTQLSEAAEPNFEASLNPLWRELLASLRSGVVVGYRTYVLRASFDQIPPSSFMAAKFSAGSPAYGLQDANTGVSTLMFDAASIRKAFKGKATKMAWSDDEMAVKMKTSGLTVREFESKYLKDSGWKSLGLRKYWSHVHGTVGKPGRKRNLAG